MTSRFCPIGSVSFWVVLMAGCISMNCGGTGNGGGGNPVKKAYLTLSITDDVPSGTAPCEDRIKFAVEPIALTGAEGWSEKIAVDKILSGEGPTLGSDNHWHCNWAYVVTGQPIGGLRTGRWRIRAELDNWSTTCERVLTSGNNTVKFTLGQQGCK